MKIQNSNVQRGRPGLNIAAMIDVVFLLMIFFVCTSSFQMPEHQMPSAVTSNQAGEPADFEPIQIELRRGESGVQILCDGQAVSSFDVLEEQLQRRRQIADIPVIIRGQKDVPFNAMVQALNASRRADLRQAAFSIGETK